jgi:hypothetical protein
MKIAMFEGYDGTFGAAIAARSRRLSGYGAVSGNDALETLIRDQIAVLQGVQKTLWDAHSKWRSGQFWIGIAIPAARLLQIGKFDYRYAVDSWQSSVDTWWSSRLTDAVRANPYERGADGKTRLQAWTDMAIKLIEWSRRIASEMADDGALRLFSDYGENFKLVLRKAVQAGVDLVLDALGPVKWIVAGGAVLFGLWMLSPLLWRRR